MVYSIVDKHQGVVDLTTRAGEGTLFSIYLPAIEKEKELVAVYAAEQEYPKGEGLILVVDDEKLMLDITTDILKTCGYNVIKLHDSSEAITVYEKEWESITAVLMDMSMPGIAGKELFERFKDINPKLKVLLISGFSQNSRIDEMLSLGVKMFLQKPITFNKLAQAIHDVIHMD
jgi:DNA-binding NtrC family response regulator